MMTKTWHLRKTFSKLRAYVGSRESGQSLVEMALLTPVLLLLLVGIIEVGRFAYYSIEVANAARAAVQYGAQSLAASKDIPGIQQAALRDASDVSGMTFNPPPTNLCACSESSSVYVGCPALSCAGHQVVFVQVDTTATITPLFRYPGLPTTFTARGHAIMRVAQ
jgi:Flp pilus assembly protein TadG